jgi:hypothetical protein
MIENRIFEDARVLYEGRLQRYVRTMTKANKPSSASPRTLHSGPPPVHQKNRQEAIMKKMAMIENFSRCPCPIQRKVTTLCSYHDEGEQTIFGITRATGLAEFPRAGRFCRLLAIGARFTPPLVSSLRRPKYQGWQDAVRRTLS